MLINCPACKKRVSDKAGSCNHCGAALKAGRDGADPDRVVRQRLRQQRHRMNMHTYAAILATVAGFSWFWYETGYGGGEASIWSMGLMGVGAVWYLGVRVWMVMSDFRK